VAGAGAGAAGAGAGAVVVAGWFVVDSAGGETGGSPVRGHIDHARAAITTTAAIIPHILHEDGSCTGVDFKSGRLKSFVI
jgi:hypothetical protein